MDQESFNTLLREKLPCVWEGLHVQVVEVAEDHVTVQIPMSGNGNDKGITAPFWSFAASTSRFIDSSNQTITYEGNVGKCPAGQFRGSYEDNSAWVSKRNYAIGSDWYVRVRTGSSVWRMFPKFPNQTNGNAGSSIQYCKNVEGKTFMYGFCSAFDLKDTDDPYDFFDFWATGASDQHSTTFINIV